METRILRKVRSEYGKKIRKDYENHTINEKRANMTEYEPRDDGITNTITTVQKDNLLLVGIKQATKKGYIECRTGGVADLSYPTSELRRGRVQGGGDVSPTLTAQGMGICRIERNETMEELKELFENQRRNLSMEDFAKWGFGGIAVIAIYELSEGNERGANTIENLKRYKYYNEYSNYILGDFKAVFDRAKIGEEKFNLWIETYPVDSSLAEFEEKIKTDTESRKMFIDLLKQTGYGNMDLWRAANSSLEMWDEATQIRYRIRKLTPKECWRLMGFTDEDFYKAQAVNSNSQLYKQAGNSIVTTCLMAIFSQLHIKGCPVWNELSEDDRNELVDRTRKNFTPKIQSSERDFDEDDEETTDSLDEDNEEW